MFNLLINGKDRLILEFVSFFLLPVCLCVIIRYCFLVIALWREGRIDSLMVLSFVDLRDIEWHFDDLGLVILFGFLEEFGISGDDEVDSNTFSTESTRSTDSVDVRLFLEG